MGNETSLPKPMPNTYGSQPNIFGSQSNLNNIFKINKLKSDIERTKFTLIMDESGLRNELANNPPESHDEIRNKFNLIFDDKKKYIHTLEQEIQSRLNENFTQVSNTSQPNQRQNNYNPSSQRERELQVTLQRREQERQNQQQRQSSENFTQYGNESSLPQPNAYGSQPNTYMGGSRPVSGWQPHAYGSQPNTYGSQPNTYDSQSNLKQFQNMVNQFQNMMNQFQNMTKKDDLLSKEDFTQYGNESSLPLPKTYGSKPNAYGSQPNQNIFPIMNQPQNMTRNNYLMMEIDKNKKYMEDALNKMNFLRQNPFFGRNPQMLDVIALPIKNQIMMHEQKIKNLYYDLEQLNREGFAHVGSRHQLTNNNQITPNSINKKIHQITPNSIKKINSITIEELANARKMWGDALVSISIVNDQKGLPAATRVAKQVIDGEYGYDLGPVLFKPTLTDGDHTFRTTSDGALSYFVGQNPKFPNDSGFALKGWRKADIETAAEFIDGDVGLWMGIVTLTDKNGNKVKVDKSWGYKKDKDGKLRIVLHHSSLPYKP